METNQKHKSQKFNSDDILDLSSDNFIPVSYEIDELELTPKFWFNITYMKMMAYGISYHQLSVLTGYPEETIKQIFRGEIRCLMFTFVCFNKAIDTYATQQIEYLVLHL